MSTSFGRALRTLFVSLLYFTVYATAQTVVSTVFGMLGMHRAVAVGADPLWGFDYAVSSNIYASVIIAMFLAFGLYAVMGLLRERPMSEDLKLRRFDGTVVFLASVVAIGCRLAVGVYTVLSEDIPALQESIENAPSYIESLETPLGLVIFFLSIVIFAPVFEEILFRGFIQSELMRGFPPAAAIVISSLIFGAAHGLLFQSVFTFFVGLICGWCYYITENITTSMIVHIVFNASVLMTSFLTSDSALLLWIVSIVALAMIIFGCVRLYKRSRRTCNA